MLQNLDVVPSVESRNELLAWLNATMPRVSPNGTHVAPIHKVEQCGNGVAYILTLPTMLPVPYPPLKAATRVKIPAMHDFEAVANLKLMQDALQRNGITRPDVLLHHTSKLIKGNFQANLQLLQWFKGLYDALLVQDVERSLRRGSVSRMHSSHGPVAASTPPLFSDPIATPTPSRTHSTTPHTTTVVRESSPAPPHSTPQHVPPRTQEMNARGDAAAAAAVALLSGLGADAAVVASVTEPPFTTVPPSPPSQGKGPGHGTGAASQTRPRTPRSASHDARGRSCASTTHPSFPPRRPDSPRSNSVSYRVHKRPPSVAVARQVTRPNGAPHVALGVERPTAGRGGAAHKTRMTTPSRNPNSNSRAKAGRRGGRASSTRTTSHSSTSPDTSDARLATPQPNTSTASFTSCTEGNSAPAEESHPRSDFLRRGDGVVTGDRTEHVRPQIWSDPHTASVSDVYVHPRPESAMGRASLLRHSPPRVATDDGDHVVVEQRASDAEALHRVEQERQFFYDKLRTIESMVAPLAASAADDARDVTRLARSICAVLYMAD